MPRRKQPDGFIGYVRVSTTAQMDEGESLAAQKFRLEEYARGLGMQIEVVPGSEPGHGLMSGRPRFREAIQKAEAAGWKLLVTEPSRLSRDVDHLKYIDLRKTPVWVFGEGQVTKKRLLDGIAIAARELQQLRSDGSTGAKKRVPGNQSEQARESARLGRLIGGDGNAARAHRNRLSVRQFIEGDPNTETLGHQKLADALNSAGILNRASEHPVVDKPWTVGSLRPVRKAVMEQIAIDDEPLVEDFMGAPKDPASEVVSGPPQPQIGPAGAGGAETEAAHPGRLERAVSWVVKAAGKAIGWVFQRAS